jgi:hypothetical protein
MRRAEDCRTLIYTVVTPTNRDTGRREVSFRILKITRGTITASRRRRDLDHFQFERHGLSTAI